MSFERIRVVLVRSKSSGNVGAVARAMKNTGLADLVLVAPRRFRRFPAEAMAVHGADVLESMRIVPTLAEAVTDCGWVVGTTCRPGAYRQRTLTPREAARELLDAAARNRVALVFGPEDHGLSNEDLKICHELVTIPTDARYSSLNVAQAALICFYEIFLAARPAHPQTPRLASSNRVEQMIEALRDALLRIGFLHGANPDHILFAIRRMFGRARLEERDAAIWLGIARQIRWFAEGGRDVAERKSRQGLRLK